MTEPTTPDFQDTPDTNANLSSGELPTVASPVGTPEHETQPHEAQQPIQAEVAEEPASPPPAEAGESFGDLLAEFEKTHVRREESGQKQLKGTVISTSPEQVFVDIGFKVEGVLPRSAFENNADSVKPGDPVLVSVTGRNEEGYYELSRFKVAQPTDWSSLEAAFEQKTAVVGTVTGVVKGGLTVDVGVRAFLPASRSGTRDAAEMEKLIGQPVTVRITKLDVTDEDVVVDRRVVLEEQARVSAEGRYAALKEGDVLSGTVRTLMPYGAFVDLGGIDGLLHISDIAWTRIAKPEDLLEVGQQLQVKLLKIDPETRKISLGLKQLQPEPWETVPQRYQVGQRVTGTATRVLEFGAFVELEPGVEGLIHVSEMSWAKKIRIASDVIKPGDQVDAVILAIKPDERRISLGLKQTLTDPWSEALQRFPVGSQVEGPVTKLMAFGAFMQVAEGVEGLIHISEISADRRLNHPSDMLRAGQVVKAQVLAIDTEKRQMRLSMKQLVPTSIDEYLAEHKVGDTVSGRVVETSPAVVELGEGIRASCHAAAASAGKPAAPAAASSKADLSSLSSLLQARWKGNAPAPSNAPEPLQVGQVRTFRIVRLDPAAKQLEVETA